MGTNIRAELSENNRYWIERHRYYELKHFCLQYPFWKKALLSVDGLAKRYPNPVVSVSKKQSGMSDPTARCAEARRFYTERIDMVQRVATETDAVIGEYILTGVTTGVSYDVLKTRFNIPCGKDTYYELYRKFFWILSMERE